MPGQPTDHPTSVSILGCGWLGLPLAERLLRQGHPVKGSTTSHEKLLLFRAAGIEPHLLVLDPDIQGDLPSAFFAADVLVISVPPGRRQENVEVHHPRQIQVLVPYILQAGVPFVIFVSSTSVYPLGAGVVREEDARDAPTSSGRALLEAERILSSRSQFQTTIVRFGGLIGGDRHPARFLAGKVNVPDPDAPVNLIHQEDCVRILIRLIEGGPRSDVFNACCDAHPTRREFYTREARRLGLPLPAFSAELSTGGKIVSCEKLKNLLNYVFVYPDPSDAFPEDDSSC